METEAVLECQQHRAGPGRVDDLATAGSSIGRGDDVGDQGPAGAQTLGELGTSLLRSGHVEDQLHVEQGGAAERILTAAVRLSQRGDEVDGIAVALQQIEMVAHGSIDVILEHGDDQVVLAGEIGIDGAAREAGGGGNGFDAGAADPLLLEDLGGGREEALAGRVASRSGPPS